MEEGEPLYIIGGNINCFSQCGKHIGGLSNYSMEVYQTKDKTTISPSNSIPEYVYQKETKTPMFMQLPR